MSRNMKLHRSTINKIEMKKLIVEEGNCVYHIEDLVGSCGKDTASNS